MDKIEQTAEEKIQTETDIQGETIQKLIDKVNEIINWINAQSA